MRKNGYLYARIIYFLKDMAITINKVTNKKELKQFIRFNYELYKNNPYKVPELYEDMVDTFTPGKNPALEFCDCECYLALDGNKVVGRVAAIINKRANERWNEKTVRFGYIDFIDNEEVSQALIDAVAKFGKSHGMDKIVGPLGFTDLDPEGMLIEGFDQLGTMATIYNDPYYPQHMEKMGFVKAKDWVEFKIIVPDKIPEKMMRIAEVVKQKFGLCVVKISSRKEIKEKNYGQKIFDLINEGYKDLFGFVALTQAQIDLYVKTYLSLLNLDMITLVETNEGKLVGVGITMGSLSVALQKAKGKLLPFGWWPLLKALKIKEPEGMDLLLVAVAPEYQNKGANSLLFADIIPIAIKKGYKWAESNPELEDNQAVQKQWAYFDTKQHKRRRCFTKDIK